MNRFFEQIHWAGLQNYKYALFMLTFVILLLIIKFLKCAKAIKILKTSNVTFGLFGSYNVLFRLIKNMLFLVGFSALMIALLRPQWDKKDEVVEQEGRDLLIALDISRSMLAQDKDPNRLEFAKQKIRKLLYNLSCERVGLLLFSGTTVLQCPLTKDYSSFFMFLDQIDVETISSGTTTLDQPIYAAIKLFDSMEGCKTKLLCLFTDGEDFSNNLSGVKEKALEQGLAIITVGIGSDHGAPVPVLDKEGKQVGFEKSEDGSIIMSKLNQNTLDSLSLQTGGTYIYGKDSDSDIKNIIDFVDRFEKNKLEDRSIGKLQEKYYYFVMISFLCFALEWIL